MVFGPSGKREEAPPASRRMQAGLPFELNQSIMKDDTASELRQFPNAAYS
ncbi:hypothetical protein M3223_13265 [Paenibacillus pasadenensis]|nr:hypothetical protein [Paenibacillus pasadenensis]MCM3748320.1 hypothetical protein [Paenibacillus pasadenensis]